MFNGLKRRLRRFKEGDDKGLVDAFFEEVSHYQNDFTESCKRILGERRFEEVEELRKKLKGSGSYITEPDKFEDLQGLYFRDEHDLRFEALTAREGAEGFKVRENGEIISCDEVSCRPFFFFGPEAIRKQAELLRDTKLPPYFTPWLHEYCHFICYCLQKHPIIVASNVLFAELRKHGFKVSYLPAFLDEIKSKEAPEVVEMADMFLGLGLIHEAQAVFLEGLFLKELGFDVGEYIDHKKEANPYCKALEKKGKEGMLCYIEDWHHPRNYSTSFMKMFLKSFQKIKVDKFTTQWEKIKEERV